MLQFTFQFVFPRMVFAQKLLFARLLLYVCLVVKLFFCCLALHPLSYSPRLALAVFVRHLFTLAEVESELLNEFCPAAVWFGSHSQLTPALCMRRQQSVTILA
jgi:hypothetical protein